MKNLEICLVNVICTSLIPVTCSSSSLLLVRCLLGCQLLSELLQALQLQPPQVDYLSEEPRAEVQDWAGFGYL